MHENSEVLTIIFRADRESSSCSDSYNPSVVHKQPNILRQYIKVWLKYTCQNWHQGYFIKIDFPGNKMPMYYPEENVEIWNVFVFPYLPLISEL